MDPLWILLVGMIVVIGGILALRLHAFLALVLGALVVGSLTSAKNLEQFARTKKMAANEAQTFSQQTVIERVTKEFGGTCGQVGILIAMASIIGKCLLDSGAADRIVRSTLGFLGESRAPLAFLSSGFLLGIPVFFDTVFLLMIPLAKAMWLRTRRNYLFYVLAIIAGATMTHSLVPPTPGPLFVAAALNVDLGLMILGGCVVGIVTAAVGFLFARWINRRMDVPMRETNPAALAHLESISTRDDAQLPPLWLALLPIFLPVVLISGNAILNSVLSGAAAAPWQTQVLALAKTAGNSNFALTISCAIALATLALQQKANLAQLAKGVQSALEDGGVIILITGAGGAFGGVLQHTGIGPRIQEISAAYHIAVLPMAFIVAALVRIAQGSATVAMITAVGMFAGMATPAQLGFHPLYLALAIGCGSKPIPWMNDSGFWVVCKMSGMTEKETLKSHSPMATIMGIVGLIVIVILARVFPMSGG